MSDFIPKTNPKSAEAGPDDLGRLAADAARRPEKEPGDVCIGKLPTRGGDLVVWSSEDSREFCLIAGHAARKLGYLPFAEVRDFLKDRAARRPEAREWNSALATGDGSPALAEGAREAQGGDLRGKVVELRELRPRAFFWETLREVLPPLGRIHR